MSLILRRDALRYLLLQRTEHQVAAVRLLRRLRFGGLYDNGLLMSLESVRRRAIARKYASEMQNTMALLRPYLPKVAHRILDIGSGLAGIDVFLNRYYKISDRPEFVLLDRDTVSNTIYYGFRDEAAAYNSFAVTRRFLTDNGIDDSQLTTIDVTRNSFPSRMTFDVVASFQSWGFHYPIETYLKQVCETLSDDGIVVLDVRRDTDGEVGLRSAFNEVHILYESRKFRTLLARGAKISDV